jgi:hypothetical protein
MKKKTAALALALALRTAEAAAAGTGMVGDQSADVAMHQGQSSTGMTSVVARAMQEPTCTSTFGMQVVSSLQMSMGDDRGFQGQCTRGMRGGSPTRTGAT